MSFLKDRRDKKTPSIVDIETFDLKVVAQTFTVDSGRFSFVKRIVWRMVFSIAAIEMLEFGEDGAQLTNGIQVKYLDNNLGKPIIDLSSFGQAFNVDIQPTGAAGAGATTRHFYARWTFGKFNRFREGIKIDHQRELEIVVQDDLSGSGNDVIEVSVQGWRL